MNYFDPRKLSRVLSPDDQIIPLSTPQPIERILRNNFVLTMCVHSTGDRYPPRAGLVTLRTQFKQPMSLRLRGVISYLSRELVALRQHATAGGGGPNGAFLVCSKDRISLYMNQTNEYVEIEPSTQKLQRWKMDMSPLERAAVTGLAVTEDGHVYASLYELIFNTPFSKLYCSTRK